MNNENHATATKILTPAEILKLVNADQKLRVILRTEGTVRVYAAKNGHVNGYMLGVIDSKDQAYCITGFTRKPSEVNHTFALAECRQYVAQHGLV